jgi:hypothetical protein
VKRLAPDWGWSLFTGGFLVGFNIFFTAALVERFLAASLVERIFIGIGIAVQVIGTCYLAIIVWFDLWTSK